MKSNFKFFIFTFVLTILLLTSFCFATDNNLDDDIMPIANDEEQVQKTDIRNADSYINDSYYKINNTINGNVFTSAEELDIDPSDNGGIIEGNLFASANTVNIKSEVTYSETEKDDIGNPAISIDKYCTISGNAFIVADKFVLESGSKIYGDLFVCANDVELLQGSIIYGNVFLVANNLTLNSEIGGSLYASANTFDMQYFGFISRDLHLSAKNATLDGYIYRDSFIEANNITLNNNFINQNDFNVSQANNLTFSGEVKGNATINAKTIYFKSNDDDTDLTCVIAGNLSYSSKQEIEIPDEIVLGQTTYSKYINNSTNSIFKNIVNFVISLITVLLVVYCLYLLISKLAPKYLNKIADISALALLKYFGIGLAFIILIPIVTVLLLISRIGTILGLLLLFIYIIFIIIAKPIFIISISACIKNKLQNKLSIYLYILAVTIVLSIIELIPYVGLLITLIINTIGFGIVTRHLIPSKE